MILIAGTLLLPSTSSNAQLLSSKPRKLTLSCIHVYPIQRKYLDRHVNYSTMSDKLEDQSVEQFIKRLDGSKIYLLEKDAKKIEKSMNNIFAQLKKKDCSAIQKAHDLYKDRVKERIAYAKRYLGKDFKFNKKTKVILDPDKRKRAKSLKEADAFHNKYMQYQVATYIAADETETEAKKKIIKNYERALKRIEESDEEDLYVSWLDSFSRSMDPHSSYLSNDALEDFEIQMRLSLDGIGATLSSKDGFTTIEQLIPGGAAFKSGQLKPKDKIMAVAQGKDDFVNVVEMPLRDVVRKIRGPKGTNVRLKILRKLEDKTKKFEVTLVRDKIKLEDDAASLKVFNRKVNGQKKKIGLVTLPSFYADNRRNGRSASRDIRKLLRKANKEKVDAVVLDLSNNGGGSLRDAVDIAGLFFARGNVVKQSQREVDGLDSVGYEVLRDNDRTVDYDGPLVVLTSRISASASEIVSGTLQDYKRAVIVGGDHTFGKGSVQSVEYLPPGLGAIKTTVGMFFTAGGNSTQHRGVDADVLIPSAYSASEDIGEKTLDYSLPPKKIASFVSKEAYKFSGKDAFKLVEKGMIQRLQQASKVRVSASEDFKEIEDDIKKIKERGDEVEVAELLDKKDDKEKNKKDGKVDPDKDKDEDRVLTRKERKEKYFKRADVQEAINIAADLIAEMNGVKVTISQKNVQKGMKEAPAAN
ncbi:MAG: carboxy terminal-processing peptidase [Bdellovibrionales bacterium]|nr:carboxy terminal-processing peptidase [Bdellovibrionales bacterium]